MTTKIPGFAVGVALLTTTWFPVFELCAQSISGAPPAIQMVSEDGKGAEKKRSHSRPDGVMEPGREIQTFRIRRAQPPAARLLERFSGQRVA